MLVGRVLEAVFRRLYRLLALLILVPFVSLAVAYIIIPHMYEAQASLWALHRYAVIGATGLESNLQASPADTQSAALTELLQTRSFALAIAHAVNLAPTLHLSSDVLANPNKLDDALYVEISQNVKATSGGYNLYVLTYDNRDPVVARAVLAQVVNDFANQSTQFSVAEGQQLLSSYQSQLVAAQNTENQDAAAEAHYLTSHADLNAQELANDPQYQALHAQTVQAQNNVQSIQNEISTIQQQISAQGSGASSLFKIVDSSHVLTQPVSRLKTYLYVGGVAFAVALLACVLYLLVILRRDRSVYTPLDLQKVSAWPVLMQLPRLTAKVVPGMTGVETALTGQLNDGARVRERRFLEY